MAGAAGGTSIEPASAAKSPDLAMGLVYAASAAAFTQMLTNAAEQQGNVAQIGTQLVATAVKKIMALAP